MSTEYNGKCGKYVTIKNTKNGKSVRAMVRDKCRQSFAPPASMTLLIDLQAPGAATARWISQKAPSRR